jgi:hypothetical protein
VITFLDSRAEDVWRTAELQIPSLYACLLTV